MIAPSIHDRLLAASRAEYEAQREQASTLLSGVVMTLLLAAVFVWLVIFKTGGV